MRIPFFLLCGLVASSLALPSAANDEADGFVPLFNGKDLTGWVPVNVAPGTFTVKEGLIIDTGKPTGFLRSEKQYENFILELEWLHVNPKGNSGLFVWADPLPAVGTPYARAIEVQILDGLETDNYTSHGDVFSIWGAKMKPDRPHPSNWERCLPSERRSKPAGQWNHYRVEAFNGNLKLHVNGKEVSGGSDCSPRKGYLCLEAEGSEAHFKNIKIKELPSTNPKKDEIANLGSNFHPLYTGLDLSGWKEEKGEENHWKAKDWILTYDGEGDDLTTSKEYGDFELVCDWRLTAKPVKKKVTLLPANKKDPAKEVEIVDAGTSGLLLRGRTRVGIDCLPDGSGNVRTTAGGTEITPKVKADNPAGKWNRFDITFKARRLTVKLNGQTIIANAVVPDPALRGPIVLIGDEAPIQFANLLIRELP